MSSLALSLHLLAAVIWVGGMFFAHVILRPTLLRLSEPPQRLALFGEVFRRFFRWVWGAVAVLAISGAWLIAVRYGGLGNAPWPVHAMTGIGGVMMALFIFLYLVPYRALRRALAVGGTAEAGRRLATIRGIVVTNLSLGLLTLVLAAAGPYWV